MFANRRAVYSSALPANGANGAGRGGAGAGQGGGGRYQKPTAPGGGDTSSAPRAIPQTRERRMDVAVVWKLLPDKSLEPVQVRTGITDHTVTQLLQALHGELKDGDDLVTGSAKSSGAAGAARAPGAPGAGARGR